MNQDKTYLIKPFCNWENDDGIIKWLSRFADDRENCKTKNIKFTTDEKADYYVIFNSTNTNDYIPERTIVFFLEPYCNSYYQTWGLKTWKFIKETIKTQPFLQVRTHDKHIPFLTWQLDKTKEQLKTEKIEKTKILSTIMSSKYFDPGHIIRIETIKEIDKSDLNIDIYGYDNIFKFKKYKGPHLENNKNEGILPYKYHIQCENNKEKNFITEKIWEGLLAECVLFYWGCPNIEEYVDPQCYIILDSNNYKENITIIQNAINNNEWEKRINIIRNEKQRVLSQYCLFSTINEIIKSIKEPIDVWIYCCNSKDTEKQIVDIKKTAFYNRIRNIYIGVVSADVPNINDYKVKIFHISPIVKHERFVIDFLISRFIENGYVLYLGEYIDCNKLINIYEKTETMLYGDYDFIRNNEINVWWFKSQYLNKIKLNIRNTEPHCWMIHHGVKYITI